jgi:hypothetical protein
VILVRLATFGTLDEGFAKALLSEGFELERRTLAADGPSAPSALASALREAEATLGDAPAGVLVTGTDDDALAAAITAVKLGIPTAWVGRVDGDAPLAAHAAELALDATADVAASARAVAELVARNIPPA